MGGGAANSYSDYLCGFLFIFLGEVLAALGAGFFAAGLAWARFAAALGGAPLETGFGGAPLPAGLGGTARIRHLGPEPIRSSRWALSSASRTR